MVHLQGTITAGQATTLQTEMAEMVNSEVEEEVVEGVEIAEEEEEKFNGYRKTQGGWSTIASMK